MWDNPFDPSMVGTRDIVINCPDEESEREMANILHNMGVRYMDGESPVERCHWDTYKERFCYYIGAGNKRLTRGSKSFADNSTNTNRYKCTYYASLGEDIDDSSFNAIIEIS